LAGIRAWFCLPFRTTAHPAHTPPSSHTPPSHLLPLSHTFGVPPLTGTPLGCDCAACFCIYLAAGSPCGACTLPYTGSTTCCAENLLPHHHTFHLQVAAAGCRAPHARGACRLPAAGVPERAQWCLVCSKHGLPAAPRMPLYGSRRLQRAGGKDHLYAALRTRMAPSRTRTVAAAPTYQHCLLSSSHLHTRTPTPATAWVHSVPAHCF